MMRLWYYECTSDSTEIVPDGAQKRTMNKAGIFGRADIAVPGGHHCAFAGVDKLRQQISPKCRVAMSRWCMETVPK